MSPYSTSRQHLFEELRRLDLILNLQIARLRGDPAATRFNDFRGLFIAEDEIDELIDQAPEQPAPSNNNEQLEAQLATLKTAVDQAEQAIRSRVAASLKQRVHLSLQSLAEMFQLSSFDIDVLLVCLAPELDLKYEKLYAYLQNDVTRKRPTTNLILNLFCYSLDEKLQARARFLPDAPLLHHALIQPASEAAGEATTLLSRALKIDERILNYLLDNDAIDQRIAFCVRVVNPRVDLAEVLLPDKLKQQLAGVFKREAESLRAGAASGPTVFALEGPEGSGKRFVAEALCAAPARELLIADAAGIVSLAAEATSLTAHLFREATLRNSVVFIDQAESLVGDGEKESATRRALFQALPSFNGIVFISSRDAWQSPAPAERLFKFVFPVPDFVIRKQIWGKAIAECNGLMADRVDLDALADRFSFTAGTIRTVVAEAKRLASTEVGEPRAIATSDLNQACRSYSSSKLPQLARKIDPLFTWGDIVLPADCLGQLKEICAQVKHRQRVFSDWGFNRKISLGKGLGILFVGPSGTGKTMAAEIIAGELALDLYKIDLSCVVSKYIGETEKNLSRIFAEAEQSNAVLFFDEADAIFGKRSEVKDAHDRYANIEINYLLQKMEEHEGIVILASNFQKNIDEAFTRRLRFIIDFPFPETDYRYRIWKQVFPAASPLEPGIDFDFLAQKLKLSGGSIRNVALGAAFLAAASPATNGSENGLTVPSTRIEMEHIVRAAKREFQKMGRLCVKSDFGQYFDLVVNQEAAT